jgi:hypothetical protein
MKKRHTARRRKLEDYLDNPPKKKEKPEPAKKELPIEEAVRQANRFVKHVNRVRRELCLPARTFEEAYPELTKLYAESLKDSKS